MRPSFHPRLVNDPEDDPGLYIRFLFQKRAIMFDLGDISAITPKDVLKIDQVYISHAHMDHFAGFDRLIRLFLGREKNLYIFGPPGILKNIEGKLAGYTWDLVENYTNNFTITGVEVNNENLCILSFKCKDKFRPKQDPKIVPFNSIIYNEPGYSVSSVLLTHSTPCLGFSFQEKFHVNIKKDALVRLDLTAGPWLSKFKQALYHGKGADTLLTVDTCRNGTREFTLGDLANKIAVITPGQKISYITDIVFSDENTEKFINFVKNSDHLFLEASFLERDKEIAKMKHHLTAWQSGYLAAMANVKTFTIFHFSPRYSDHYHLFNLEAEAAFKKHI